MMKAFFSKAVDLMISHEEVVNKNMQTDQFFTTNMTLHPYVFVT